jgi:hypothetical protein
MLLSLQASSAGGDTTPIKPSPLKCGRSCLNVKFFTSVFFDDAGASKELFPDSTGTDAAPLTTGF